MFSFTTGELLFYGGIIGMVAVAVAAIVIAIVLAGGRKRMRSMLSEEYGQAR
jgi:hypothetical protein